MDRQLRQQLRRLFFLQSQAHLLLALDNQLLPLPLQRHQLRSSTLRHPTHQLLQIVHLLHSPAVPSHPLKVQTRGMARLVAAAIATTEMVVKAMVTIMEEETRVMATTVKIVELVKEMEILEGATEVIRRFPPLLLPMTCHGLPGILSMVGVSIGQVLAEKEALILHLS
jgi:hypothetical protein